MSGVEIYLYANCSSCRSADALLKNVGVAALQRDLFKERLSSEEIKSLVSRIGRSVSELLSTRSRPYAELGLAGNELTDDEIVDLMAKHPALIRRPIVVRDRQAVVGFKRDAIEALVKY
jgi:Spx/MgsR family transcriptional regulator